MNPLDQYPKIRKILYIVQWIIGGVTAVAAFVLTSLGDSPQWFIITSGALSIVWTYAGLTASGNVNTKEQP